MHSGDDMTRSLMDVLGPGQYEADPGSSTATLSVGTDEDSISCIVNWGADIHRYVKTTNVFITVRDGPAFAEDNIEYTGYLDDPGPWVVSTVDLFNSDPASGPTSAPTPSPTTAPTPNPWKGLFKDTCTNCKTVQTAIGPSLQCTCPDGKGNSVLSTCYASCCESLSASNNNGVLACDGRGNCTDSSTGGACWNVDWTGSFTKSCTNCQVMMQKAIGGAPLLQCECQNLGGGSTTSACYTSCCPSKSASNINGVLACDGGGSCTDSSAKGACPPGPGWDGPADESCICHTEIAAGLYANVSKVTCTCPDPWARPITSVCYSDCCPSRSLLAVNGRLNCAGYGPCVGSGNASCKGQPVPPLTSISLRNALPPASRNGTRVIGCHVRGLDPVTQMPVSVDAVSKLLRSNGSGMGWEIEDFGFPYRIAPCNASGCIDTAYRSLARPGQVFASMTSVYSGGVVLMALGVDVVTSLMVSVGTQPLVVGQSAPAPDVLWTIPSSPYDDRFGGGADQVDAQFNGTDHQLFVASPQVVLRNGIVTPAVVSFAYDNTTGAYAERAIVGTGDYSCVTDQQARFTGFKDISGAWRHPHTGDLFTVDTACGLLYRIDARALDDADRTGDGRVRAVANISAFANAAAFQPSTSSARRTVRLTGDAVTGTLYIAYVQQCGIVKVNLNTGAFAGWVLVGRNQQPICGFGGDDNLAVGQDAGISRMIGGLTWDDGDLYIADTGNQRIRVVSGGTGLVTTVAGNGLRQSTGDRGPATAASLSCPTGLAVVEVPDSNASPRKVLFLTEACSGFVRRVLL